MDILRVASWAIHHVLLASSNVSVKLGVACWSAVVAGSSSTTGKKPLRPNLVFFSLLSGHENAEKMALDMENHGQSQDFCWTSDFRGEFHLWPVRILRTVAVSSAPERQAPWQSVVNQCLRLCLCTPGQIIQRDQTFLNIYLFSDQLYDHLMIIVEQLSGIQWLMAWIPGFFQSGPWNCPALLWPGDLRDLLAAAVQLCCSAFCLWRRFAMRSRWVGVPSWDKELLPKPHLCIVTDSWLSWGFRSFQFGTSRKDMCFRGGYISDDWWLPRISKA